ncbi:MAG: hypothetical protein Fur0022_35900 [Anaerolineales bacterium]
MLPCEITSFVSEQFVWGKILREGKDISGYKIVARSSGLSDKVCAEVLSRTGAGVSQAILRGRRAYAFFHLSSGQVVFSCTQRSPKPEHHNRHYLQTHFLVCAQEQFELIQADLPFLANQIGEIRIFEHEEELDTFQVAYQRQTSIESDLRAVAKQYPPEFLINTYRALKGNHPIAIFDSSPNELKMLVLFQLLFLLTPKAERQFLTFASMSSGGDVGKYSFKFKVNPTGILKLPHIVIRLDDAKIVPPNLVNQLSNLGVSHLRSKLEELTGEAITLRLDS